MAISKTRNLLVDVARQLFARNGVDDTTMNDIALASKKGRRTLYTYFKSKEDICFIWICLNYPGPFICLIIRKTIRKEETLIF